MTAKRSLRAELGGRSNAAGVRKVGDTFPDIEFQLHHLAVSLPPASPGDWLASHAEKGQDFRQYLSANPNRKTSRTDAIYVCVLGDMTGNYGRVIEETNGFLSVFFDAHVRIRRNETLACVPERARRKNPTTGQKQLLAGYVLEEILERDMPDDAFAYVAVTTRDLWGGEGSNFVFGQAHLRRRVAVWSLARNGYPGDHRGAYQFCLRRSLAIAAHEMGHVLTMQHCTAFRCLMNGCNSQAERDRVPLPLCPVCLRKLLWNLEVEPTAFLRRIAAFFRERNFVEDAAWHAMAADALEKA